MDFESLINSCISLYNERQEVLHKTVKTNEEHQKWQTDTLHFYRMQIEPFVFNYLNHTYGQKLDEFWKTHQFPKKSDRAFVIIERRVHPNWWFVLRNIAWAAPHFSLYIFCSDLNYDFIKSILGDKADNVNIIRWFKEGNTENAKNEYNITLKLPGFFKLIDAEYMINFQMDTYFLQKIPDWIFVGTYYGAPWCWNPTRGGTGISIRNIKDMIEIYTKELSIITNNYPEDCFICDMIEKYNYSLPSFDFRCKVIQENFPTDNIPIGIHQFWTYLANYNITNKELFASHIKKITTIIGL
jgi:hypothetical protein